MLNDVLFRRLIKSLEAIKASVDQNTQTVGENTQSQKSQQKPPILPVIKPRIGIPPAIRRYIDSQAKDTPATRDKIRLGIELGAVIVGAGLAWLTYETLQQVEKQVKITQKQLEAADRPWIKIAEVIPRDPFVLHEGVGPQVGITFILKNVGNSVARNVTLHPMASVLPWGQTAQQIIAMQEGFCRNGIEVSQVIHSAFNVWDVFPGETLEKNDYAFGFLPQAIEATAHTFPDRNGRFIEPIVYGCIDYQSPVSDTHFQTGFLYFLRDVRATPKGIPFSIKIGADVATKDLTLQRYIEGGNYAK